MIDPQALLADLSTVRITLSPAVVQSSLITLAVSFGVNKLFLFGQRGKRIGRVSGPIEVVRVPGWVKRLLGKTGVSAGLADIIGTGLGLAVFLVFTYLTLDNLSLPFRPWSSALLALAAAVQLGVYAKSLKGTCVGYEKGLVVEGAFHSFEKLSIERQDDSLHLRLGKARLVLGWAQFERNKKVIRDPILHLKFDAFQRQRASAAPVEQVSAT